jgi:hypothetical protein
MADEKTSGQPVSTADLAGTDPAGVTEADGGGDVREPLLPADQGDRFTTRWTEIQASFVDEPRDSVEQADALVAD